MANYWADLDSTDQVEGGGAEAPVSSSTGNYWADLDQPPPVEAPPEPDESWEITKGAKAGLKQTAAIGQAAIGMAGDAMGFESLRDWGMEGYKTKMEEAEAYGGRVKSYADVRTEEGLGTFVDDASDYIMYTTGNAVAQFLPTIGLAGLGGVAGRAIAKRGVQTLVEAEVKRQVAKGVSLEAARRAAVSAASKHLAKGATRSAAAAGGAAAVGLSTGEIGAQIYDETGQMRPGVALGFGVIAGALEFAPATRVLDRLGIGTQFRKEVVRNLPADILIQAGAEGLTESLQTVVERAAVTWVDENKPMFTPEAWEEIINSGIAGSLGGGVIQTGVHGINALGVGAEKGEAEGGDYASRELEDVQREESQRQAALESEAAGGDALDQTIAAIDADEQELRGILDAQKWQPEGPVRSEGAPTLDEIAGQGKTQVTIGSLMDGLVERATDEAPFPPINRQGVADPLNAPVTRANIEGEDIFVGQPMAPDGFAQDDFLPAANQRQALADDLLAEEAGLEREIEGRRLEGEYPDQGQPLPASIERKGEAKAEPHPQEKVDTERRNRLLKEFRDLKKTIPAKEPTKTKKANGRMELSQAVAASGGLNWGDAESNGFDPAGRNKRVGVRNVFTKKGKSLDGMAEHMNELGFSGRDGQPLTANTMLERLDESLRGGEVYGTGGIDRQAEREAIGRQLDDIEQAIEQIGADRELDATDPPASPQYQNADPAMQELASLDLEAQALGELGLLDLETLDQILNTANSPEAAIEGVRNEIQTAKEFREWVQSPEGDPGPIQDTEEPSRPEEAEEFELEQEVDGVAPEQAQPELEADAIVDNTDEFLQRQIDVDEAQSQQKTRDEIIEIMSAKHGSVLSESESPDGNRYAVGTDGVGFTVSIGGQDGWESVPGLTDTYDTKEEAATALADFLDGGTSPAGAREALLEDIDVSYNEGKYSGTSDRKTTTVWRDPTDGAIIIEQKDGRKKAEQSYLGVDGEYYQRDVEASVEPWSSPSEEIGDLVAMVEALAWSNWGAGWDTGALEGGEIEGLTKRVIDEGLSAEQIQSEIYAARDLAEWNAIPAEPREPIADLEEAYDRLEQDHPDMTEWLEDAEYFLDNAPADMQEKFLDLHRDGENYDGQSWYLKPMGLWDKSADQKLVAGANALSRYLTEVMNTKIEDRMIFGDHLKGSLVIDIEKGEDGWTYFGNIHTGGNSGMSGRSQEYASPDAARVEALQWAKGFTEEHKQYSDTASKKRKDKNVLEWIEAELKKLSKARDKTAQKNASQYKDWDAAIKNGGSFTVNTGKLEVPAKPSNFRANMPTLKGYLRRRPNLEMVDSGSDTTEYRVQKKGLGDGADLFSEANQAATSPLNDTPFPSDAQIDAGNYKKGHVSFQGLDVTIENPEGSTRSGTASNGKPWSRVMKHHYGYIKRTEGADGDHVDVFIGPKEDAGTVFVVDQRIGGKFDEHKVMLGFGSQKAAEKGYLANYDSNWKIGPVTPLPMENFKQWLETGDTTKPMAEQADSMLIEKDGKYLTGDGKYLIHQGESGSWGAFDPKSDIAPDSILADDLIGKAITRFDTPQEAHQELLHQKYGVPRETKSVEVTPEKVEPDKERAEKGPDLRAAAAKKATKGLSKDQRMTAAIDAASIHTDDAQMAQPMIDAYYDGFSGNPIRDVYGPLTKNAPDVSQLYKFGQKDAIDYGKGKFDLRKPMSEVTFREDFVDEAGDTVTVEQNADKMMRQIDKRLEVLNELLDCVFK